MPSTIRVIPTLLLKEWGIVKTVRFREETYIGCPINAVRVFNADVLTAYFNPASVQHTLLKSNGFRRDLRKKVNVVMRELNPSPGPNPQLAQTWGLSMGDLEFL